MARAEREVQIRNRLGMHARAAVRFVQTRQRLQVRGQGHQGRAGGQRQEHHGPADAGGGARGDHDVVCEGDDATAAVAALAELVDTGFGEGVDP